jgi:hypothetical protein
MLNQQSNGQLSDRLLLYSDHALLGSGHGIDFANVDSAHGDVRVIAD